MVKRKVREVKTKANAMPQEGTTERIVCDICGATFKDKRGMAGHMAGRHGVKWGVNATLDNLCREIEGMKLELTRMVEAANKQDAAGQRCIELASFIAKKRHPDEPFARCLATDAKYQQAQEELELLKGLAK